MHYCKSKVQILMKRRNVMFYNRVWEDVERKEMKSNITTYMYILIHLQRQPSGNKNSTLTITDSTKKN